MSVGWFGTKGWFGKQLVTFGKVSGPVCLAAVLLFGGSVAAQDAPSAHDSILAMLEADLGEVVIRTWLDKAHQAPSIPTAEQLIALKQAGASDGLLTHLLEIGVPAAEPTHYRPSAAAEAPAPSGHSSSNATLPSAPPAPRAEVAVAEATNGEPVVDFSFLYSPTFDEGEAEWDLFVYLDGIPLTYVPASSSGLLDGSSDRLTFSRRVAPGKHVIRLVQERHQRQGGRWRHQARVAEEAFEFELGASRRARIEVEFRQRSLLAFGNRQPLTFSFVQGDLLTERKDVGGEPEDWPELCEELEADAANRKRPKAPKLEGCVRWDSLWQGLEAPDRNEVRTALAELDFRPVARQQPFDGP